MCGPWEETFAAAKLPSKPYNDDDDDDDDEEDEEDDDDDGVEVALQRLHLCIGIAAAATGGV